MRVKIEYGACFPEVAVSLIQETEKDRKELEELKRTILEYGISSFDVKIEDGSIVFVWGV